MSITLLNSITSVIAGFAIFSILGYIAANQGKDVDEVVTDGKLRMLHGTGAIHIVLL